jgi:acetyl-CoA carboxylase biotin carboxyl carrier protein
MTEAAVSLDELCRQAIDLIGAGGTAPARIRVQAGEQSIEIDWRPAASDKPAPADPVHEVVVPVAAATAVPNGSGTFQVRAPMVGTFYRAGAPGEPPFVEVGDEVEPGQQLAILEAMKLMNPLEAEHPGRVVEVLAENGSFVEYDQPLFVMAAVAGP